MVGPVALFPDPLLTQVLAAASFSGDVPAAAEWADRHRGVSGQRLADALWSDHLRLAPSVQVLLPFPALLHVLTSDMKSTTDLGTAVLAQQREVLDAIARQRRKAVQFGWLRTEEHIVVDTASQNTMILPRNPAYISVPSYDPDVVFSKSPAGTGAASAISFDEPVNVGGFQPFGWKSKPWESLASYFQRWGWGQAGIDWDAKSLVINGAAWRRTWDNRGDYVHPYPQLTQAAP